MLDISRYRGPDYQIVLTIWPHPDTDDCVVHCAAHPSKLGTDAPPVSDYAYVAPGRSSARGWADGVTAVMRQTGTAVEVRDTLDDELTEERAMSIRSLLAAMKGDAEVVVRLWLQTQALWPSSQVLRALLPHGYNVSVARRSGVYVAACTLPSARHVDLAALTADPRVLTATVHAPTEDDPQAVARVIPESWVSCTVQSGNEHLVQVHGTLAEAHKAEQHARGLGSASDTVPVVWHVEGKRVDTASLQAAAEAIRQGQPHAYVLFDLGGS